MKLPLEPSIWVTSYSRNPDHTVYKLSEKEFSSSDYTEQNFHKIRPYIIDELNKYTLTTDGGIYGYIYVLIRSKEHDIRVEDDILELENSNEIDVFRKYPNGQR